MMNTLCRLTRFVKYNLCVDVNIPTSFAVLERDVAHFLLKRPLLVITQNARLNSSDQTCDAFMGNPNLL